LNQTTNPLTAGQLNDFFNAAVPIVLSSYPTQINKALQVLTQGRVVGKKPVTQFCYTTFSSISLGCEAKLLGN
jgi:hypothetical protein